MDESDPRRLPWQKLIDIPPMWLALFLAMAWVQSVRWPLGPSGMALVDLAAGVLVGGGILLMGLALWEMRRARTTVMPHLDADALVTSGVFARSRNPIYLGDVSLLTGLILYWNAWPSLVLVPLFVWLITDRFIRPEEDRLRRRFGRQYEHWAQRVRRWV